jgi:hypothetical protein
MEKKIFRPQKWNQTTNVFSSEQNLHVNWFLCTATAWLIFAPSVVHHLNYKCYVPATATA